MITVEKLLEQARRLSPGSAGRRSVWAFLAPLAIPLLAALLSFAAPSAFAQAEAPNPSAAKLAEEFSDPLTSLPQLFTQDAYTPVNYGTAAPRMPRCSSRTLVNLQCSSEADRGISGMCRKASVA